MKQPFYASLRRRSLFDLFSDAVSPLFLWSIVIGAVIVLVLRHFRVIG